MDANKVDWSLAPSWAQWWSTDHCGAFWWSTQPEMDVDLWMSYDGERTFAPSFSLTPREACAIQRPESTSLSGGATLPKTSPGASANTPSEEFRYTWWEPATAGYGSWHRSKDSALAEANDNYHGFPDNFKERDVYIVECVGVANAGESRETRD